jgi:succinoglycan biosynthesis protein ExoU
MTQNEAPESSLAEIKHNVVVGPCVDVLIAARDRSVTIQRAVKSALDQKEVRAVFVVDDGSTDDTADRARLCDRELKRVVVERLQFSVGPSAARNRALELSDAPWVAILDGDDFFLPGRMSRLLSVATSADFVADDIAQMREDEIATAMPKAVLFHDRNRPFSLSLEQFILGNVRPRGGLRTELGFIKPIMRRSFLDRYGLRYDERLRLGEDYALYVRALLAGARLAVVPSTGYASVWRSESLSGRHTKQDLERLRDSDAELIASSSLSVAEKIALRRHYWSIECRVQWLNVIDAFKVGDYWQIFSAFGRSPIVSRFLIARLLEEFRRRALRWIGSTDSAK